VTGVATVEPAERDAAAMPARRPRVAILHQGFIPRYRVRFYELLSGRGAVEYVVFHGDPPSGSAHRAAEGPFEFPQVRVESRELQAAGRWLVYQPVVRRVARDFDAVVLGDEAKFLSSLALQGVFAARGRPVAIWGAGFEKEESLGRLGSLVKGVGAGVKQARLKATAGYLVYTDRGREALLAAGVPADRVTVVRNTLDMGEQIALRDAARRKPPEEVRARLGLERDSVVLLYLGRVYREKRVDELVRLVREMRARDVAVEAVVIGDGPALADAEAAAAGTAGIHFPGRIDDQPLIADYMRVGQALVIPGKVGLALNHAFAHGVPVLSQAGKLHAPEADYLRHGYNGLMAEGDFGAALEHFVTSPAEQANLARGALATRDELSLERMVAAFDGGVRRMLRMEAGA
jgi:glycosyltransferase involved in cell wall biosynthesis